MQQKANGPHNLQCTWHWTYRGVSTGFWGQARERQKTKNKQHILSYNSKAARSRLKRILLTEANINITNRAWRVRLCDTQRERVSSILSVSPAQPSTAIIKANQSIFNFLKPIRQSKYNLRGLISMAA